MLGTTEGRRFLTPSVSQAHQPPVVHFPPPFPLEPFPNLHHLAGLHSHGSGSSLASTPTNLWPGSPTLSSTTGPLVSSSSASCGRLSAFALPPTGEGEFSLHIVHEMCTIHISHAILGHSITLY